MLPLPNINSPLVVLKDKAGNVIASGTLVAPWNTWFQQFSRQASAVQDFSSTNPLTVNNNGTVILTGATTVSLTRGTTVINLTGERIIPVSIGDTVAWTGPATVQFLGAG